jgi:hypothetical protein
VKFAITDLPLLPEQQQQQKRMKNNARFKAENP